ncbi:ribosomal protein L7/L12 [Solirubrobacter sp. CPCC 204708]|uniref:Ribosomal protein L7/L12 n=1 Tax=Solirubrobacter deserti TaxID=2282478 RepID=A0ABT4RSG8_9ACTN|nr:ribosomal protein L7/L12 [Solirubrobacter deserti]MBE2316274.1 ribosomal protein L7/L12 [Solirubrobacter deserti]MDA0141481.1 ribosomal protein L7/L12 [Solirubrobacter deserti]
MTLTLVDLGPNPAAVVEAVAAVLDVGPRRASELVEQLPAYLGDGPMADVLREELERLGAVAEDRERPPAPPVPAATPDRSASVTLLAAGPDRVRVAKAVRLATGYTLAEAKRLVAAAPTTIAVPPDRAAELRRALEAAGARVG